MANSKWGTKRACLGCGKPFYDMQRTPIVCPSCDVPFEIVVPGRVRRQRATAAAAEAAAAAPPAETAVESTSEGEGTGEEVEAVETDGSEKSADAEEEEDEAIENASELGEDEGDVAEVIEGME